MSRIIRCRLCGETELTRRGTRFFHERSNAEEHRGE